MLTLYVNEQEFWDRDSRKFIDVPAMKLDFEHSLASLSKWEEIWEIPFLSSEQKTNEQTLSYIKCMLLTESVPDAVLLCLNQEHHKALNEYITAKHTATTFPAGAQQGNTGEFVTAELIYYWLTALNIPFSTDQWHLNKLLTLVKLVNRKNTPPKKMSRSEAYSRQRQLNAARRAKYGTSG